MFHVSLYPGKAMRRLTCVALMSTLVLTACQDSGLEQARPKLDADTMKTRVSEALQERVMSKRYIAIAKALEELTIENASGAGAAYSEDILLVRSCEMRPFTYAWAAIDAEAAVDYSLNLRITGSQRRREAISESVRSWTNHDQGAGAMAYLATLDPSTDDYRVVSQNTVMGLAEGGHPELANGLISSLEDNDTRDMLVFRVLIELLRGEPDAIKNWVNSIPSDAPNNLKATAFERAMALIVGLNPTYAMEWFQENQFTDYAGGKAIATILKGLVETRPEDALAWVMSLPPSDARNEAVRDAAYNWLKAYPEPASEFLRANLHLPELTDAIFPYAQYMIKADHVQAVDWALRVPVPYERVRVLSQALIVWGRRDRPAVIEWLKANPEIDEPALETVVDLLSIEPRELS